MDIDPTNRINASKSFWRSPRTLGSALAISCLFGSWLASTAGQPAVGQLALVLAGAGLGVALASRPRPSAPVLDAADSQESLRKSETMSAMGQLVAGVAHEVRNPLFAISANLDALEIQFGDDSPHAGIFAVLHNEVDRLSDLMQELLDYGRPHGLEVAQCALSEVVSQAIRATVSLARTRDVEVLDAVPGGLPQVPMDAKRIGQVLQNLIENAIQHTGAGGHVMVTASVAEEHGQEQVVCSVLDDGSGFREQDLPRIFEPFFTRRRGGTGLGLSIVARIVEEHGGRVTAGNRREGGAIMVVMLPFVDGHRRSPDERTA